MATLKAVAGPPTGEEAEKSDVDSLLRLVRAHERQHDDRAYDSSAPAAIKRCKTMLTKLRKLLPKLMRPIASLPTDKAVPVLQDLCQLLLLLLGGSVCPHSKTLFMENNSRASGSEDVGTSGFPSYPTMATMLFYMVSFYCNEKLQQAQSGVRSVVLKMAHFLLSNDVHGFLHFFNDTVQFLEDCFLLEDCLKQRESTGVLPGGVFITCFLDTAIHVYQDADGPLGSTTNATLCGCMPITDEDQLDKRRDQLSRMLPPVHVASYRAVVELRQSMTILADQIIYEHGAMVEKVPAYERLCQLVELFLDKNGTLLESASDVFEDGAVSKEAAGRVAQSTFRLLYTMMQASASTDEREL
ncbi:multidrug-resistance type transporter aminotriazole resistance [Phytophthora boehmeriae]|uniref:Multidrug-resistance type transporter aminotriazole resistance n=1 Tax=Phytophthora boehmeriae TaxID=109152 RepID=A0A8T1XCU7_9STRA|nr:multidrug-resistance type transporter aminotriazole resistance [Phytophthora boehmeriae]